jgi:hypothetical protein
LNKGKHVNVNNGIDKSFKVIPLLSPCSELINILS